MAAKQDQELHSATVKRFHAKLRTGLKTGGKDAETLWREHLDDCASLQEYASAMCSLATGYWARHGGGRIQWCVDTCEAYFHGGQLRKLLLKDLMRIEHGMPMLVPRELLPATVVKVDRLVEEFASRKWHLLDVGSCYNPFAVYPQFEVTAVDIAPAIESVSECDFLNVDINDVPTLTVHVERGHTPTQTAEVSTKKKSLPAESYDFVVFSLLLSYLPSTAQRLQCCVNAHRVLRLHGLLLIITPDSSHQNKHTAMMKSWKNCIEAIGFHRWRYFKDTHLHCLAFRKTQRTGNYTCESHPMLFIPQDSRQASQNQREVFGMEDLQEISENFQELPFFP